MELGAPCKSQEGGMLARLTRHADSPLSSSSSHWLSRWHSPLRCSLLSARPTARFRPNPRLPTCSSVCVRRQTRCRATCWWQVAPRTLRKAQTRRHRCRRRRCSQCVLGASAQTPPVQSTLRGLRSGLSRRWLHRRVSRRHSHRLQVSRRSCQVLDAAAEPRRVDSKRARLWWMFFRPGS